MMQNASYLCIAKRVTGHGVNSNQLQNILQVFLKFLLTKQKFHCIISPVSYTGNFQMRKWRNWQTRRLQVPVVAIPCGFKSHLPHLKGVVEIRHLFSVVSFSLYLKKMSCPTNEPYVVFSVLRTLKIDEN